MSPTTTTMPMMIWTTWLPEPPRIPATISAASTIGGPSDAGYPSNRAGWWHRTASALGSASRRAGDEPLAVEERRDDAKQNDVGNEQDDREHHRERDARCEDVEGHQRHHRKRREARQRSQLLRDTHVAGARRNPDTDPDRPARQERREED